MTGISDQQRQRAQGLLASMPFGGLAHLRHFRNAGTIDGLLDDIELLRDVLREHGEKCNERQAELYRLHADFAAVGRALGAAGIERCDNDPATHAGLGVGLSLKKEPPPPNWTEDIKKV